MVTSYEIICEAARIPPISAHLLYEGPAGQGSAVDRQRSKRQVEEHAHIETRDLQVHWPHAGTERDRILHLAPTKRRAERNDGQHDERRAIARIGARPNINRFALGGMNPP